MLGKVPFFLPVLLSIVVAFTVPGNEADGFYSATYDANGKEVHTLIKPAISRREPAPSLVDLSTGLTVRGGTLSKRTAHSSCKCDSKLDHGNTDAAVADLKSQVGQGVYLDPTMSYYSIRGSVVAFACNKDGNSQLKVWADIITQSAAQITKECGQYVTGSVGGPDAYTIGYMATDQSFCDSPTSLPADHC